MKLKTMKRVALIATLAFITQAQSMQRLFRTCSSFANTARASVARPMASLRTTITNNFARFPLFRNAASATRFATPTKRMWQAAGLSTIAAASAVMVAVPESTNVQATATSVQEAPAQKIKQQIDEIFKFDFKLYVDVRDISELKHFVKTLSSEEVDVINQLHANHELQKVTQRALQHPTLNNVRADVREKIKSRLPALLKELRDNEPKLQKAFKNITSFNSDRYRDYILKLLSERESNSFNYNHHIEVRMEVQCKSDSCKKALQLLSQSSKQVEEDAKAYLNGQSSEDTRKNLENLFGVFPFRREIGTPNTQWSKVLFKTIFKKDNDKPADSTNAIVQVEATGQSSHNDAKKLYNFMQNALMQDKKPSDYPVVTDFASATTNKDGDTFNVAAARLSVERTH